MPLADCGVSALPPGRTKDARPVKVAVIPSQRTGRGIVAVREAGRTVLPETGRG